jgi:hypothetical protein
VFLDLEEGVLQATRPMNVGDRLSTDNKHMIKYIMRKIVLSLFALCCFSAVMAQQKTRNLSVELLGAQNIVGINYDSRFDGNSGLGYRYQRPNGFMFRVGVSPSFNFGDKYGLKKAAFFPYIGLGWSF